MKLIKVKFRPNTLIRKTLLSSMLVLSPSIVLGNPKGAHQTKGDVSFDQNDSHLIISASDKSVINWQEFSIQKGEVTQFVQPHSKASVLNRVTGDQMSEIYGSLKANGRVFLINPNGVMVGKEGVIQTAGFIASTLDVTDRDFGEGKELLFKGDSEKSVINLGQIESKEGDIILIGFQVKNEGTMSAPKGTAGIGGGSEVLIKPFDNEKIFIRSKTKIAEDERQEGATVSNSGTIEGLKTEIKADGNPYKYGIQTEGLIEATGIVEQDGCVYLVADDGVVSVTGEIISRKDQDQGGEVRIFGDRIHLLENCLIDATGDQGGGKVLVGGEFQGINSPYKNARQVFVGEDALIDVSARNYGSGGEVILWSDLSTSFFGSIIGEGGKLGGNGAFVEISGNSHLNFSGTTSLLSHYNGKPGRLLLDPTEITIGSQATTPGVVVDPFALPALPSVFIQNVDIITALMQGDVMISTANPGQSGSGDINVDALIMWGTGSKLSLTSHGSINVNAPITNSCQTGASISLTAEKSINVNKDIFSNNSTATGNCTTNLTATSGDINIAAIDNSVVVGSQHGEVNLHAPGGNINVLGGVNDGRYAIVGSLTGTSSGNINVTAGHDLNLVGGSGLEAFAAITRIGVRGTPGLGVTGDINVAVGGNTSIAGGSQTLAQAFIGHGGFGVNSSSSQVAGSINMDIGGDLELRSGVDAESFIGTASNHNNTQDININVGGNLFMHHSEQNAGANIFIGAAEALDGIRKQNLHLVVGKNITMDARDAGGVTIQPMFNGGGNCSDEGIISIMSGGDIQLIGGNKDSSFSTIFLFDPKMHTQVYAGGNIRTYNGLRADATFPIPHAPNSDLGNVDIRAAGNVILGGGNMGDCPAISTRFISNSCPIRIEADAKFDPAQLWSSKNRTVNGQNIYTNTPLGNNSGNVSTTDSIIVGQNCSGALAFDTAKYSANQTAYPSTVDGFVDAKSPNPPFAQILPAENSAVYKSGDKLEFLSAPRYADGVTPANLTLGYTSGNTISTPLEDRNFLVATAATDLTIGGHYLQAPGAHAQGNMMSCGYSNITINRVDPIDALNANSGDLLVLAHKDIYMTGDATANSGGDLTFVVDNQAPAIPQISTGKFVMGPQASLTSGGEMRIFTSRQSLNTVDGYLNGQTFTKGPKFVDSDYEKYGTYYSSSKSGTDYVILYKESANPPQPPEPSGPSSPTDPSNGFGGSFELFVYLGGGENYLKWDQEYQKRHDKESYSELKTPGSLSSFETLKRENYFIRRKYLRMYTPMDYRNH